MLEPLVICLERQKKKYPYDISLNKAKLIFNEPYIPLDKAEVNIGDFVGVFLSREIIF